MIIITLEQWAYFPCSNSSLAHELSDGDLEEEHGDSTEGDTDEVRDEEGTWKYRVDSGLIQG